MAAKIIAVANQKGGVGKTTTTINLGVSLARLGKRVLLVDLDPQGNLTMAMGIPNPDDLDISIAKLLVDTINRKEITENYILNSHDVDIIPSNIELTGLENILLNTMNRESILKKFLEVHKKDYDYILIDCSPSLNTLTINALNASDEVIIPVQVQFLSAKGLELLLHTVVNVQHDLNPDLKIGGILLTMRDKRSKHQANVINIIAESYGAAIPIFESIIPISVQVSEKQSEGIPISNCKNNTVGEAYANLAKELLIHE